jgi:probable rRNA maturation factor
MERRGTGPPVTVHVNLVRAIDPLKPDEARDAAIRVLAREWENGGEVSITFDGDERLRELNREYLGRRGSTDVIAFDLSGDDGSLVGDIYISVDRAAEQADEHGIPREEELLRLEVHGILHLVGYDHETDEGEMWARQERWVDRLTGRKGPCR